jgi:PilZ domain
MADLEIQVAEKAAKDQQEPDRRRESRYQFTVEPTIVFLAKPSFRPHEAGLRNVTNAGLALIAQRRFMPGTLLAIRMPTTDPLFPEVRLAEVRHFSAEAQGGWLHGCRFASGLSADEMLAWLQKLPLER